MIETVIRIITTAPVVLVPTSLGPPLVVKPQPQEIVAEGPLARVIQHEFDHLNGVLFLDHLSPLRRRLLQRRLKAMARGEVEADYPLAPPA